MRASILTVMAASLVFGLSACKPSSAPASSAAASAPVQPAGVRPAMAAAAPAGANAFTGTIAETMNSGGYTYARLHGSAKDDVWVAAPQFDASVGEQISVSLDMPMQGFESKTLNRTFPLLYFVAEVARSGNALAGRQQPAPLPLASSHGAMAAAPREAPTVTKMDPPAGGLSVADVFAKRNTLSGKAVTVRGTVVKFNGGILDRNWIHLQDGSGSAAGKDNDLTITSDTPVKVGDVITASGVLGLNRDFGAGYAYEAMVEKASITK